MQEGAFAFIDCLGWKGIWKRTKNPQTLINKVHNIETFLDDIKYDKNSLIFTTVDKKATISFLSDTVVISVQAKDETVKLSDAEKGELIASICFVVLKIMTLFLAGKPALTMRGCIVYGEHIIDKNLILGKAVDECAVYETLAEGAFVWIHPDASTKFEAFLDQFTKNLIKDSVLVLPSLTDVEDYVEGININDKVTKILKKNFPGSFVVPNYDLPIKGGNSLKCSVLNPLILLPNKTACLKNIKAYSESMNGGAIDVLVKKQNTERFLTVAEKSYDDFQKAKTLVQLPFEYKRAYRNKHKRKTSKSKT